MLRRMQVHTPAIRSWFASVSVSRHQLSRFPRASREFRAGMEVHTTLSSEKAAEYSASWDQQWKNGIQQGERFDARHSAPTLVNLLESDEGQSACNGKRAVIPGCGRGYDLITFAKVGGASTVVGVEISETAAEVANSYIAETSPDIKDLASVTVKNWLDAESAAEEFDIGYDYTFFCALHPSMREAWADGWARHLKAGGTLIALAFPMEISDRIGPPWPLQLSDYEKVLEPRGFKCVKQEPVPQENTTAPGREGLEILTVWKKQ